jgi:cell division protein FtsQ
VTPPAGSTVDDSPGIDPRIRQRRVAIRRREGQRRLRWLMAGASALGLVILVLILLHTPLFGARAITVTGVHPHTSDAAIVAASGLAHHPALISVDTGAVAARVGALPYIASARVSRHWPDGVQIDVTERVPVVQMFGPATSWSILDGHGRTLQVQPGRVAGLVQLIAHTTGGGVPPAAVGKSLPPVASAGLEVCRTLPRAFSAQVVSVSLASDDTVSLALNSGITVLLGTATDLPAKYEDVAAIIARGTLQANSTIDASVPESPTVSS